MRALQQSVCKHGVHDGAREDSDDSRQGVGAPAEGGEAGAEVEGVEGDEGHQSQDEQSLKAVLLGGGVQLIQPTASDPLHTLAPQESGHEEGRARPDVRRDRVEGRTPEETEDGASCQREDRPRNRERRGARVHRHEEDGAPHGAAQLTERAGESLLCEQRRKRRVTGQQESAQEDQAEERELQVCTTPGRVLAVQVSHETTFFRIRPPGPSRRVL